jgi:cyanate lyase
MARLPCVDANDLVDSNRLHQAHYRLIEIVPVYGSTIKEWIHQEFGNGIMSSIELPMDLKRRQPKNAVPA